MLPLNNDALYWCYKSCKAFTTDTFQNMTIKCGKRTQGRMWCRLSRMQGTFCTYKKIYFSISHGTIFPRNGASSFTQKLNTPFKKCFHMILEVFSLRYIEKYGCSEAPAHFIDVGSSTIRLRKKCRGYSIKEKCSMMLCFNHEYYFTNAACQNESAGDTQRTHSRH